MKQKYAKDSMKVSTDPDEIMIAREVTQEIWKQQDVQGVTVPVAQTRSYYE